MVHIPLLPPGGVVIEMFNCGHFSYLYANMALNMWIRYFAMQRLEPYCYRPRDLVGQTRQNLSVTYAYTQAEAEPMLMQAVRYHMWQDPGAELTGQEKPCILATKYLEHTGTLPPRGLFDRRRFLTLTPGEYRTRCLKGSTRLGSQFMQKNGTRFGGPFGLRFGGRRGGLPRLGSQFMQKASPTGKPIHAGE